jgi:cyclophilin family peptidyl-prolyl cis-trans isomerase
MGLRKILIKTSQGDIYASLELEKAPITAGNFIDLIGRKWYDGLTFHRYEPNFVIQGGCPKGNGTGDFTDPKTGKSRNIQLEVSKSLKHDKAGTLAMARSQHPDSASCQFYITLAPTPFLDDNYAVFGYVTDGLDVVQKIRKGDKIESITLAD